MDLASALAHQRITAEALDKSFALLETVTLEWQKEKQKAEKYRKTLEWLKQNLMISCSVMAEFDSFEHLLSYFEKGVLSCEE